jgi:chromate transporter
MRSLWRPLIIDNLIDSVGRYFAKVQNTFKPHTPQHQSYSQRLAAASPLFSLAENNKQVESGTSRFFLKLALVSFGGAYAILAYVAQYSVEGSASALGSGEDVRNGSGTGRVQRLVPYIACLAVRRLYRRLSLILVEINALTAGVGVGASASWATFTPCFLWHFSGAPFVLERLPCKRTTFLARFHLLLAAVVGVND